VGVVLHTARLVLRRAEAGDLAAMHAVLSDPAAMRYWSTPPHTSLEQTERWLRAMIEQGDDDFVVTVGDQVVGKAGFFLPDEVGYILHPRAMGRGIGSEAVHAVIHRAFAVRGRPVVRADVDPRNRASLALLAKLGFVETGRAAGTFQVGDELCDSVYLEVTQATFRAPARAEARQ
jgi:[ribosomal protein S5]-alanine N-acetyltransferase